MKSLSSLIMALIFTSITFVGCSEDSDNDKGVGGVSKPTFSKGVSQADEIEFLSAMDQFSTFMGQGGMDSRYLTQALVDIETHRLRQRATVADRSDLGQYRQLVATAMQNCTTKSRTETVNGSGVSNQVLWAANSNATSICKSKMNANIKKANSSLNGMDRVGTLDQSSYVEWSKDTAFLPKDFVSVTAAIESDSFSRQARPNDFNYGTKSNETYLASYSIKMKNGGSTSLQVGSSSEVTSRRLDDSETHNEGSRTLTLSYLGTSNPIYYQRTDSYRGTNVTTVIMINDEEVFRSPR